MIMVVHIKTKSKSSTCSAKRNLLRRSNCVLTRRRRRYRSRRLTVCLCVQNQSSNPIQSGQIRAKRKEYLSVGAGYCNTINHRDSTVVREYHIAYLTAPSCNQFQTRFQHQFQLRMLANDDTYRERRSSTFDWPGTCKIAHKIIARSDQNHQMRD